MWINENTLARYATHSDIRAAFRDVSFPEDMGPVDLSEFGIRPVVPVDRPAFDPITQRVDELSPANVAGVWTQQWSVVALDAATIAANQAAAVERERVEAIEGTIAADSTVAQLKAMTNAEFDTWWAANVTNAAQAINVLKRVARIVIRRVL